MDLIEATDGPRHPWEKARAAFFTAVVTRAVNGRTDDDVLDCGAGDAFFSATLSEAIHPRSVTCWDASYDAAMMDRLKRRYARPEADGPRLSFTRSMPSSLFDLVLMLDVIEHVEDDRGFVESIVDNCLDPNGLVLVSVPAWQPLFSRHDDLLKHYRRYAPGQCERVLEEAGLRILEGGGLFHSLLLPRAATVVRERVEKVLGRARPLEESGAGTWAGGPVVTTLIDTALRLDNAVSHGAARAGLKLPGLSYWVLARKR